MAEGIEEISAGRPRSGKAAIVIIVSVRVHLAADPSVCGISTSSTLNDENYSEIKVAETAVQRCRAAKNGMDMRRAEKRLEQKAVPISRQSGLFASENTL